jgi:adenine phosphoribosyltransferase
LKHESPAILSDVLSAPLVPKPSGYKFRRYGFGEESHRYGVEIMAEVGEWSLQQNILKNCDLVGGIEPGGLPWALALGAALKKSVVPLRAESMRLRTIGGDSAMVENEYSRKSLFLKDSSKGETIVLFDDVISSGATIKQAAKLLSLKGFRLIGVAAILVRNVDRIADLERKIGCPIQYIVDECGIQQGT